EAATSHGDSMLFTAAIVLLVVRFVEEPKRRHALWCLALVPFFLEAIHANNRRTAWVELAACAVLVLFVSRSRIRRFATHAIVWSIPVILLYIAVGWNSSAKIFAPIQMYRSIGDGQVDASTLYRDLENFNLLQTLKMRPIFGKGFGQPFDLPVTM